MSATTGRLGWVGLALEGSPGAPTIPSMYLPVLDCTVRGYHDPIGYAAGRGVRDKEGPDSQQGKKWGAGNIRAVLDPNLAPMLIGTALGTFGTPTNEGSGVYTHVLSRKANNVPNTLSLTFDRVVDRQLFHYLVVSNLALSFSEDVAEVNASCLSKFPVVTPSGSLTTSSGTIFTFGNAEVKLGVNLATAEVATPLNIKDFSLNINNYSEIVWVGRRGNEIACITHKDFEVTGSMSVVFENTTQRDIFNDLRKRAAVVYFEGNEIGAGLREFVKFRIARMRFPDYDPRIPLSEVATEGIEFTGEYSDADAKTIDAVVRGRTASY